MKIYNAKVFRNGAFTETALSFSDKIEGFAAQDGIDAKGAYIIPGLIDVHTHGAIGIDGSDCVAEDLPALAKYYADRGVTSFLFTTMTISREELERQMKVVRGYERGLDGAKIDGVHLEGGRFLQAEQQRVDLFDLVDHQLPAACPAVLLRRVGQVDVKRHHPEGIAAVGTNRGAQGHQAGGENRREEESSGHRKRFLP